jgi:single-strand DNA-binding protein
MMNQVWLHGNTGNEPKSSYTTTGKLVVKFSLAVNRNYGEKDADWFQVECWGKLADVMAKHGFKGQELIVRGSIRTESYDKDGDT